LQDDEDGNSWVLNNKQGFQDCEKYATLEAWLDKKMDEYWDTNFESIELVMLQISLLFQNMLIIHIWS
jgi:hypothetical protein